MKIKFYVAGLACVLLLPMWGQTSGSAYVSGTVKGFTGSPRVLYNPADREQPDTLVVSPDGTFSIAYNLQQPAEGFIAVEADAQARKTFCVYLTPGSSVHVAIQAGSPTAVYSGTSGKESAYIDLQRNLVTLSDTFAESKWLTLPGFKDCRKYVDAQYKQLEKALSQVSDRTFVEKQNRDLARSLPGYYFAYATTKQKAGYQMEKDADFIQFVEGINFNDTAQANVTFDYLNWYATAHPGQYNLPDDAAKLRHLKTFVSNQDVLNTIAENILSVQFFAKMFGADLSEILPAIYREYLTVSTDSATCAYVQKELDMLGNQAAGIEAADLKMTTANGETISLKELVGKGKYTYIDFWATWCAPCCKEIPYIEMFAAQYKDSPIRFVSISIDKDRDKWLKKIAADKPQWEQYQIPETDQKACAEVYGITEIPRFMLFDKEGKMMQASASRPSDPKTQQLFDQLK